MYCFRNFILRYVGPSIVFDAIYGDHVSMPTLDVTKVGIDGIESMVSIIFSMIFRFEKYHRYIKHVSHFEPQNFDTQSESSLKHRYQKACKNFCLYLIWKLAIMTISKGMYRFRAPNFRYLTLKLAIMTI